MKNKPIELASGAWLAGEAEVYFFILVFEHARSWRKKKKDTASTDPLFCTRPGEHPGSSDENRIPWLPFVDRSEDQGKSWTREEHIPPASSHSAGLEGLIQPTLWESQPGHVMSHCCAAWQ